MKMLTTDLCLYKGHSFEAKTLFKNTNICLVKFQTFELRN